MCLLDIRSRWESSGFLLLFLAIVADAKDIAAVIVAAVLADTMGKLHFLAARALDDAGSADFPVCRTGMLLSLIHI